MTSARKDQLQRHAWDYAESLSTPEIEAKLKAMFESTHEDYKHRCPTRLSEIDQITFAALQRENDIRHFGHTI